MSHHTEDDLPSQRPFQKTSEDREWETAQLCQYPAGLQPWDWRHGHTTWPRDRHSGTGLYQHFVFDGQQQKTGCQWGPQWEPFRSIVWKQPASCALRIAEWQGFAKLVLKYRRGDKTGCFTPLLFVGCCFRAWKDTVLLSLFSSHVAVVYKLTKTI